MSGKWLGDFRSGTRSEYLALYGLSRIASVCPVPRQEDFGIRDLVCVLTVERKGNVYPESAFYVQVKSNLDSFEFDEDAVEWIAKHMDQPLFICCVDKDGETLRLFSCAPIWLALLTRKSSDRIAIKIHLKAEVSALVEEMRRKGELLPAKKPKGRSVVEVNLGPPVLTQTLSELETDYSTAYKVMKTWILLDAANIAKLRLGRIAVTLSVKFETNKVPPLPYVHFYAYGDPKHRKNVEDALIPVLTALGHNYRDAKKRKQLAAIRMMLNQLDPRLFDKHAREFADGTMKIP